MTDPRPYADLVAQLNRLQRTLANWNQADRILAQSHDQYESVLAAFRSQGVAAPTLPEDMQADLDVLQVINKLIQGHIRGLTFLYERTLQQLASTPEWTDTRIAPDGTLHYHPQPTPEAPRSFEERLHHLVERISHEEWSEDLMRDIFTTIMEPDGIEALTHAYTHQSPR